MSRSISTRRALMLYRPRLPGQRAQAIQVMHAAEAMARAGWRVTVLADRGPEPAQPADALAQLGLAPHTNLNLEIAPVAHSGLAGLWFRRRLAAWWSGPRGLVLARDKRRLVQALDRHGPRHRIVVETHELDSALAREAGRSPTQAEALEETILGVADALIANCGGTLQAWRARWPAACLLPQVAAHNATNPDRRRAGLHPTPIARVVGSYRAFKGIDALARWSAGTAVPLEFVGGAPSDIPGVQLRDPVPYTAVPDLLGQSAVLLLPLMDNLFGRELTSPLKMWDYLATDRPIVAPDLPTVREIQALTGAPLHLWTGPGLTAALDAALQAPPRPPIVRSWDDRLAEIGPLLEGR